MVRNSRDAYIVAAPYVLWAFLIIFAYLLTIAELKSVRRLWLLVHRPGCTWSF